MFVHSILYVSASLILLGLVDACFHGLNCRDGVLAVPFTPIENFVCMFDTSGMIGIQMRLVPTGTFVVPRCYLVNYGLCKHSKKRFDCWIDFRICVGVEAKLSSPLSIEIRSNWVTTEKDTIKRGVWI